MKMRQDVALVAILLTLTCLACSANVDIETPSGATLDWKSASIVLPLDSFGMTSQEAQVVAAAGSIVFAQCVLGREAVTADVLTEARRALLPIVPDPYRQHWLYGVWNEDFIVKFGWEPFPSSPIPPRYLVSGIDATERCIQKREQLKLTPITTASNELLGGGVYDAYRSTLGTKQYRDLVGSMARCLNESGFASTAAGGARVDTSWATERIQLAKLTEARCSDRIQFVARILIVHSRYEYEFIRSHMQELSELRKEVRSRVTEAETVLSKAGVYEND